MNIMFLNAIEKNTYGGVESWMVRSAGELACRGHKVVAVGRPGAVFMKYMRSVDKPIEAFEINISGDFNPFTINRILGIIKNRDIEAILVTCNKDLRLGGLAARWHGRTKVVWRIGVDLTKNSPVHRKLTPRLLDGVIAPSQDLKNKIIRYGYLNEKTVTVIPSATTQYKSELTREEARSKLREKYRLPPEAVIAVTSGRFVPEKGHRFLVEATGELVKKYPVLYFLFLGNGPLEPALKNQVSTLRLNERVIFTGFLDDFELEMVGADLMVHPAVDEAFGNALLDGLQAGLPVVAAEVGGIPEVIEDGCTGLLVPPGDAGALKAMVEQLLDKPELIKQLGEAGQKRWRENFTLETMVDRLENYLKKLVA
ncbi:MAG: glycosyltransferase family 4 protein [candidate division Zixibacteria bacterium]|nr:glycosyltransferase family 4 protein [candidate division Zixibacteria bacterium]